jgi:5-methylcytosine-specific restriction endonuclease McrA
MIRGRTKGSQLTHKDEFTCRECGEKNIYLQAHHIKSFADFPELRFNLTNGKTLCKSCHYKISEIKL